jgi:hypothetical protein
MDYRHIFVLLIRKISWRWNACMAKKCCDLFNISMRKNQRRVNVMNNFFYSCG